MGVEMPNTEVVLDELPMCNFVHGTAEPEPAHYDGATIHGPWAFMCEEHFRLYGIGLGLGKGQRLVVRNG
jgi:hypothetical protein